MTHCRLRLMQLLRDDFAAASADQQRRRHKVVNATSLEQLLDLRTRRRVERIGSFEVWGPTP